MGLGSIIYKIFPAFAPAEKPAKKKTKKVIEDLDGPQVDLEKLSEVDEPDQVDDYEDPDLADEIEEEDEEEPPRLSKHQIEPGSVPYGTKGTELVVESREWYIDQSRRLFLYGLCITIALICSIGTNIAQVLTRPQPVYFAVTPDLRVMELPPLSIPVVSDNTIVNWTVDAVTRALSLDFLHYREKLMDSRINFHPEAFNSFVSSLQSSGNLQKIQDERLNLSCVMRQAALVTNSGVVQGRMTWRIEMPILLSYQSSRGIVSSQPLLAQVLVQRASTLSNPRGIVIRQIVLARG